MITESQYVYQDEDDITHIFFLNAGKCSFVLPKHDQINYINIDVGATFGTIDIIGSILKHSEGYEMLNDWITHKDKMKRQFTVCSKDVKCELLAISIMDLWKMKNEFLESYEAIFDDSYIKLYRTLRVKLRAMKHCQDILDREVK